MNMIYIIMSSETSGMQGGLYVRYTRRKNKIIESGFNR